MTEWFIFAYGIPALAGLLVFLKIIADRLAWVEAAAEMRAEELAAAALQAAEDEAAAE